MGGFYRDMQGFGFPKIAASFFGGGSVRRSIISGDLYPGSPYLGNLP